MNDQHSRRPVRIDVTGVVWVFGFSLVGATWLLNLLVEQVPFSLLLDHLPIGAR